MGDASAVRGGGIGARSARDLVAVAIAMLGALSGACSGSSDGERAGAPSVASAGLPTFAIHEWGVIDVDAREAPVGGALPPSPTWTESVARGATRIVAVHLRGPGEARLSLAIDAPEVLEVWPRPPDPRQATWADVIARAGGCDAIAYPAALPCDLADGVCAAADAARHDAPDGACLEVGGTSSGLLLYRARAARELLPVLAIAHAGGEPELVVRAGARPASIVRVRTATFGGELAAAAPIDAIAGSIAELDLSGDPAAAEPVIDRLLAGARDAGLTEAEASTFARTWGPTITGRGATAPIDALYYWLDAASAERLAPMRVEPAAAEIRRAFLVRVILISEPGACAVSAGGTSGRRASSPRVRLGEGAIHGALSHERVRRAVRAHVAEVSACYGAALAARPDLAGRVSVAIEIAPDGSVARARLAASTLGDRDVERCIETAARGWTFPAPDDGAPASAELPFVLDASD